MGCLIVIDIEVGEFILFLVIIKVIDVGCFEGKDGMVLVEFIGGIGFYIYVWDMGVLDFLNIGLEVGSYVVIVIDSNGCEIEVFVDVG